MNNNKNATLIKIKTSERTKKYRERNKENNKTRIIDLTITQKCMGECKEEKIITEFPKDSHKKLGYANECKACRSKRTYFDPSIDPNTTMKACVGEGCNGAERLLIYFTKQKQGRMGYANKCSDCRKIERRKKLNIVKPTEGVKYCKNCEKSLSVTEFNADKYSSTGLQTICKTCQNYRQSITYSKFEPFINRLLKDARKRSKKKNFTFNLTKEQIIELYNKQNGLCALTSIKMTHNAINDRQENDSHILNPYNISIDRIDSSLGYIINNVQLVCALVNNIKFTMKSGELLRFCYKIYINNLTKRINEKRRKIGLGDIITYAIDFSNKCTEQNAEQNATKISTNKKILVRGVQSSCITFIF